MATFSHIGLAEPSTITKALAAVTVTRNSSATEQELLSLADPESSLGVARVTNARPDSTMWGLVVRQAWSSLASATLSTALNTSTSSTVVSSAATVPHVIAFTATSTTAGPIVGGFYAGASLVWPVTLWANGGHPSEMMAVSPPAFLFKGAASEPITFQGNSTAQVRVGVTYWRE